jgi:ABC-type antimicrobial peptide transport system permease subunit
MILLGLFASAALLLAIVGIYGMLSYVVSRRTHDMAIRVAIGARGADVVQWVVSEGLRLSTAGIVFGLAAAAALTRVMKNLLFGVSAIDSWTFSGAALLLCLLALLASYVPALRASRVDPAIALRLE